MNGGSGDKRVGTLPIFARKRPRVALMAFSSSQNPATTPGRTNSSLEHVQERSYFTPSEKENYQHYDGNKPVANWRPYKPPTSGHVTKLPFSAPQTTISQWDTPCDSFNDTASSIDLPSTHGISSTKSLVKEDVKPLIKKDVNTSHSQLLKSVRMLTATSQGVQHWSKYQPQMNLVFEVYGTLTSSIQSGEFGARRFTLQAVDGPLNCLFWEIDYKIPASLVRGHLCRVVGTWNTHKSILKCVSVRSADRKEFGCVKNLVSISDRYMRQTVLSLHET